MTFTGTFDRIVIPGEYIACETEGFAVVATLEHDSDTACEEGDPGYESWAKDEWHYFGLVLAVWKAGVCLTKAYAHARWGIDGNHPEGDNSYFTEVANDLLPDAIDAAKAKLKELCTN